ncbi:unnamed protein product [Arctogadus glacialis]
MGVQRLWEAEARIEKRPDRQSCCQSESCLTAQSQGPQRNHLHEIPRWALEHGGDEPVSLQRPDGTTLESGRENHPDAE